VPNVEGRVTEKAGGSVVKGQYVAGWCKRGPTGLIGTNSLDAKATVDKMKADHADGLMLAPTQTDIRTLLHTRSIDSVSWADWQRLDAWEQEKGRQQGKLRTKIANVEEMMRVVHELRASARCH
jgi:ferredoxin--NADP+ reductase